MDSQLTDTCRWMRRVSLATLALGLLALALAIALPVRAESKVRPAVAGVERLREAWQKPDWAELLPALAGRNLIAPSQVRAAVKNTGEAAVLVKRLRLQGIVQMGGQPVAYVQVEKEGLKVVRKGDKLLEFSVDAIGAGHVNLSLEGVAVTLTH